MACGCFRLALQPAEEYCREITTRTKPADAIEGTSRASKAASKVCGTHKFPLGIKLLTLVGFPPFTLKMHTTR